MALPAQCAAVFDAATVPSSAMHWSDKLLSFRVPAALVLELDQDVTFTLSGCGLSAVTTVRVQDSGRGSGE